MVQPSDAGNQLIAILQVLVNEPWDFRPVGKFNAAAD